MLGLWRLTKLSGMGRYARDCAFLVGSVNMFWWGVGYEGR